MIVKLPDHDVALAESLLVELESLGSADAIAERMRREGVRGCRADSRKCLVANYLGRFGI